MNQTHEQHDDRAVMVAKAHTGIAGLDEITHGGLPAGRPTLVCGGPGCGKTILAMEFLVRGALEFDEPGLFVSFEESIEDLHHNFRSFGFDLKALIEQVSKRRMRVVKYRGSAHGMDKYPFLIGDTGFTALPISSIHLEHGVGTDRVGTGVPDLDAMMGGQGFFRGSTVLISGGAGAGKSTLAAAFAAATCEKGEKCLQLAFEESAGQLIRNMRSVGIELQPWIDQGLLSIQARRPTLFGIEEHLMAIFREVRRMRPKAVVIDPITNFLSIGAPWEVKSLLTRVLDQLRGMGATVLLTSLTPGDGTIENSEAGVSSMTDTWIALNQKMNGNLRQCYLYVLKSRGMEHSREVRELKMSASGLSLRPVSAAGSEDNQRREPSGSS